jgi:hypothetical protein
LAKIPGAICTPANHHARLKELSKFIVGGELVVTTVRNHWDAIASWWLLDQRRISLWNFIDNYNHSLFQRNHKLWWLHSEAKHILRYETLQSDLDRLLVTLDIEPVIIQRENVTPNKRFFLDYYSNCTYEKVLEYFYDEIIYYGYHDATEEDTKQTGTGSQDSRCCDKLFKS